MQNRIRPWLLAALCSAAGSAGAAGAEPAPAPAPTVRFTGFATALHSALTDGQPDGEALALRGVWAFPGGDALTADLLGERKFGRQGGVAAFAYSRVLSPDWYAIGTAAFGHGGPNWATLRVDGQLSRKWLAGRQLVTSVALYHARYVGDRSDAGGRAAVTWYAPWPAVFEAGTIVNVSQPGRVRSQMPYLSATFGREGESYLAVRAASGTEAYQALGDDRQLVDFHSETLGVAWRRWLGRGWGVSAQAEHYRNPSYRRATVGAGLFVEW